MIACLPPSDLYMDENISTLTYATKASYIANEPNKNEDPRMKIIHELRKKVSSLEKELRAANDHINFLTSLTGGGKGQIDPSALFLEKRPQFFEQEVKLDESEPPSMKKQHSEATEDVNHEKVYHQHSMPIEHAVRMNSTENEDFKSDVHETKDTSKMPMTVPQGSGGKDAFNNCIVQLDPDTISHRLIESVSMVTDLLQSNRQLRDTINSLNKEKENMENDN